MNLYYFCSVIRLWNYGILNRLNKKYFIDLIENSSSSFSSLDFQDCVVHFVAWMIGVTASLIILSAELLYWRLKKKNHRRIKMDFVSKKNKKLMGKKNKIDKIFLPRNEKRTRVQSGVYNENDRRGARDGPIIHHVRLLSV